MKYSIIIPTFNHFNALKKCVDSLIANTDLTKCDTEVIIVSNGCQDETADFIMGLPEPFNPVVISRPLGYPTAVNIGLEMARGYYTVVLNNDTVLYGSPNAWINILEEPFKHIPECGITGPLLQHNHDADMDFVIFFCAMISRPCLTACGRLDSIFSPGSGEDIDFCIRAQQLGFKISQVPAGEKLSSDGQRNIGSFPIYHSGEETVHRIPNWGEIFNRNMEIIKERYGKKKQHETESQNRCDNSNVH